MLKVTVFEFTPPGFLTLTLTRPAVLGSCTTTISEFAVMKLVKIAAPLKITAAPLTKFDPLTVITTVVPTVPDEGDRPLTAGVGESTVNDAVFDVPPPGAGLDTWTPVEPTVALAGSANVTVDESTNVPPTETPLSST